MMDTKDEQALLYLAGMALQGWVARDERLNTLEAGFMCAHLARSTLHYLKNPDAPRPEVSR